MADGPAIAARAVMKLFYRMSKTEKKKFCASMDIVKLKLEKKAGDCLAKTDFRCLDNVASEGVFLERLGEKICRIKR